MSIFKSYDIRGIYPRELTPDLAYAIGNAFARFIRSEEILVGRDVRTSSPTLSKAFIDGVRDAGTNAKDLGICTTPQLHLQSLMAPAAMITASHNPKEYNGIKLYKKGGEPIGEENGLATVERYSTEPRQQDRGKLLKKNTTTAYIAHIASKIPPIDPSLRLVIDASNGCAGTVLPKLVSALKLKNVKRLYWAADGKFPHHSPNPLHPRSILAAKTAVKQYKAHLGAIIDADADRVVFLDENGTPLRAEQALVLFSRMYTSPRVVHDLRMGWVLREELRKMSAESLRSRVGRTNIYSEMRTQRAHVGGELSGHYYFRDNHYTDDALVALFRMASLVSRGPALSETLFPLQRYATSGEINFEVADRQRSITKLYNLILAKFKGAKIDFLDGLSAEFKDWWFNVRPSNTQPLLRLIVEAKDQKILDKRVRYLKKVIGAK